ncbi:MAG: lysylphosphatidylglycerol synthase transmembrane domain-containing protein [Candidatus Promineifilaceae bacterium]
MEQSPGRRLHFWLGILISLASLAAIFLFIPPAEILSALRQARYDFLLLAAISLLAFLLLRAVRWRFLLNRGGRAGQRIPFGRVFHVQNIGYLLMNILPFRLGDVARAILIGNRPPVSVPQGLATILVERLLDLLFIIALFPFTLLAVPALPGEVRAAVRLLGLLAAAGLLTLMVTANRREWLRAIAGRILERLPRLNSARWLARLDELLVGLDSLTRPLDSLVLVLLSVLVWLPIILGYQWALQAVDLHASLLAAAFVVCMAAFGVSAPSSPGQVGVFEASVIFALAVILRLPEGQSASFAFLWHAMNYLVFGLFGAIGINRSRETLGSVLLTTRNLVAGGTR